MTWSTAIRGLSFLSLTFSLLPRSWELRHRFQLLSPSSPAAEPAGDDGGEEAGILCTVVELGLGLV
jgi:hypothetical protein